MGKYYGVVWSYGDQSSLMHYGIAGQKWGIRRFQYENGSYTEEGKKRYGRATSDKKTNDKSSEETQKHENKEFNPRERWGSKNSTPYEGTFERITYSSTVDKKLMKRLKSIIDKSDDPEIQESKKLGNQYSKQIDELNDAFSRFDKKYGEEHGPFDGDGTEAHWTFEKLYPEYKQISDKFYKAKGKFIDSITKLAESGKFDDIKEFDKYQDCFEEIQDPKTGEYWYKHASSKTFPIAIAISDSLKYDIFPQELIVSYDSKGNVLYKPWDEEW